VNCAGQPIPVEEQNAPGFYYIVRWCRLPNNSSLAASGWGAAAGRDDVHERTVDADTDTLTLAGQPVYRSYENRRYQTPPRSGVALWRVRLACLPVLRES